MIDRELLPEVEMTTRITCSMTTDLEKPCNFYFCCVEDGVYEVLQPTARTKCTVMGRAQVQYEGKISTRMHSTALALPVLVGLATYLLTNSKAGASACDPRSPGELLEIGSTKSH